MLLYLMEVIILSLSYKPLWDMLAEKGISKMEFAKSVEISNATLAKMGKDEAVSLTTIDKICNVYDCDIENIVKHLSTVTVDNNTSNELEIGTVIILKVPLRRFNNRPSEYVRSADGIYPYVITQKLSNQQYSMFNNTNYAYNVATLSPVPASNNLYILLTNYRIQGLNRTNFFIRLDTIRALPEDAEFQIVGSVPQDIIDKIIKFNTFMENL